MKTYNIPDRPGICYSNISLIKKALLQNSNKVLPYPEIVLYVKKNWTKMNSTFDDIEKIVKLALNAPKSYFIEVEEGLWGIKDQVDHRLDHIFEYMDQRKKPLKTHDMKYRLKVYEPEDSLIQLLSSDIRFVQIDQSSYWILSHWTIINDLIYDYINKSELLRMNKEKVIEKVVQANNLNKRNAIFLPQFDNRFILSGDSIVIKNFNNNETTNKEDEVLEIPIEIKEEIGRLSYKIINFLKERKKETRLEEVILQLFDVRPNETSFNIYEKAIKEMLQVVPVVEEVSDGLWKFIKDNVPGFQNKEKENVYYAVRNSEPSLGMDEVEELRRVQGAALQGYNKETAVIPKTGTKENSNNMYAYQSISYYDRIRGSFTIPNSLIESSMIFAQSNHGKVFIQHENLRYEWFWEKSADRYFFYGNGVMDFFADNLIEPGHRLKFTINKGVLYLLLVHIIGFDERYASEQQRYLDMGRLVEESRSTNKSIFSLMCETLAVYPSGMH